MNAGEVTTVIGKSVKIVGDLSGGEDLVLDGELEGTIQLSGARLTIGPAARVRADIVAQNVIVFGRLEGDIRSAGRVELRATALVLGNIFAGSLSVEENAAFRGQVDPSRSQEPLPAAPIVANSSAAGAATFQTPRLSQLPPALAAAASRPLSKSSATDGEGPELEVPAILFADIQS